MLEDYCIPRFSFEQIDHEKKSEVLVSVNDMNSKEEKRKVVNKLQSQFRHPMPVKLIQPMKNADIDSKKFCVIKEDITKECEVCLKYCIRLQKPCGPMVW